MYVSTLGFAFHPFTATLTGHLWDYFNMRPVVIVTAAVTAACCIGTGISQSLAAAIALFGTCRGT